MRLCRSSKEQDLLTILQLKIQKCYSEWQNVSALLGAGDLISKILGSVAYV